MSKFSLSVGRILMLLIAACLTSCAAFQSQTQRERQEFNTAVNNYHKTVSNAEGSSSNPDDVYFNHLIGIAKQFHQYQFDNLYTMMWSEAVLKKQGLPNSFDSLQARYDKGDAALFGEAESYILDVTARAKCNSFGFAKGTPQLNKCAYDFKVQYFQLMLQQQQMSMQMTRPAPIAPTNIQTNCVNTLYGGVHCKSTGY